MAREIVHWQERCHFCNRNQYSKLCDFPKGTMWSTLPVAQGGFRNQPVTCDNRMCAECAKKISHEVDFCPTCVDIIKGIGK